MLIFIKDLFRISYYSSFWVVVATCINSLVFFKIPNNNTKINYWHVALLGISVWVVYLFDRILDNANSDTPKTKRHQFHQDHQFNLSILTIALCFVNIVILFFQVISIFYFGLCIVFLLIIYFLIVNKTKNGKYYKEIFMPIIYTFAVAGIGFLDKKSINLSSWIIAIMFFLIVLQNIFNFSYFEHLDDPNEENILTKCKMITARKVIFYANALIFFLCITFFTHLNEFTPKIAWCILLISTLNSLVLIKSNIFLKNERYRWALDGLFFLFLFVF